MPPPQPTNPNAPAPAAAEPPFRALIENSLDAVCLIRPDGTILYASPATRRVLGYTPEEFVGQNAFDLLHPDDRGPAGALLEDLLRRPGESVRARVRSRHQDGSWRWLEATGTNLLADPAVAAVVVNYRDVTEVHQAQEALRVSRERLDLAVRATELGLWYCDLPFDKLVWNDQCKAHFGLPPDAEVTIDTFYERLHPDDRERARREIERAIAEHTGYDIEYRTVAPGGRVRWVRAIGRCFYDEAGKPTRFDGITVDVTRPKRAEEALKDAHRRKDQFLAMLAHELRNPLAPILNGLAILRLRGADPAAAEQARALVERQVRHMARLIDDLLDVSRVTRGKVQLRKGPLDLAGVVARAVEMSRPFVEARNQELTVALPPAPLRLEGDATRLEQVLANLLTNAAKYTPPFGRIWLTAGSEAGAAVVRVRDSGCGISPELLPHLFEPFTQADASLDRSQGGLGIGLSLVRGLVELHGGSVSAHSDGPGKGSEFVVRLPLLQREEGGGIRDEERQAQPGLPSSLPPPPSSLLRRILVVDDLEDSAESLAVLLRLMGHEVNLAHDGPAALEAARRFHPEVVFLDIGLPGMDGYEVARRLRQQDGPGKVFLAALTGYGQEEDLRRSRAAGFDCHLVKPVAPDTFQQLLARLPAPASASGPAGTGVPHTPGKGPPLVSRSSG